MKQFGTYPICQVIDISPLLSNRRASDGARPRTIDFLCSGPDLAQIP